MVEPIAADAGHEQVAPAVIVVIGCGRPHAVDRLSQATVGGDVGKPSLSEIAKQSRRRKRLTLRPGRARPRPRVDEEQVAAAVAVVVECHHARSHCLWQQFAASRTRAVRKRDARRGRDVGERHTRHLDRRADLRRRRHDDRIGLRWLGLPGQPGRRGEQAAANQQGHQCQPLHGAFTPGSPDG